jgi:release factor glutamine methyltransferase
VTSARGALQEAEERLTEAGVDSPQVDAELLLAHVLGTTRSGLHADSRRELSDDELGELESLVARRAAREPLAYVLGEWGFRRLILSVDPRVLVPRPETEVVVERCLARIAGLREPRVLDVGTGSGAIALAIADEHPGAWDLVVSNPPYIGEAEVENLGPEVRDWEPRAAVVGEGTTEGVARAALGVLRPGGALVLETAGGGAEEVANLLRELGYDDVRATDDLTARSRVAEGLAPGG